MIDSFADTANRQRGVDIKAKSDDGELWITVKGYPEGTRNTPPSTQASHWFKQAIFDVIDYRNQNVLNLGIALPDFPRYHSLSEKTVWLKNVTNFKIFWVDQQGNIFIE